MNKFSVYICYGCLLLVTVFVHLSSLGHFRTPLFYEILMSLLCFVIRSTLRN